MIVPKHLFERLQGRQFARGAGESEAGRHRPLPVCRFQTRRHGQGRAQSRLSCAQPAVFRHDRDEGRRRRRFGGARRHPERRIRLCVEHAGRGRDPAQAGEGGSARDAPRSCRAAHRAHPAQQHRPLDRGRRRALEPQDDSTRCSAIRPSGRRSTARRSRVGRAAHLWADRHRDRKFPQQPGALCIEEHDSGSSTSTRQTSCSKRPAGSAVPTASGERTARS